MFLMNKEICRVLQVGGTYMSISFATPDLRYKHMARMEFPWETNIKRVGALSTLPVQFLNSESQNCCLMRRLPPYRMLSTISTFARSMATSRTGKSPSVRDSAIHISHAEPSPPEDLLAAEIDDQENKLEMPPSC